MKNKFVLASLTAIALTALAACGSTVQGAAVGGGAAATSGAPIAPSDITSADDPTGGTDSDPSTDESGPADPNTDETSPDDTSTDQTNPADPSTDDTSPAETSSDETTAGGAGGSSCEAFTTMTQGFSDLLQKLTGGDTVTQQDVDAVFTDETRSALPASLGDTFDKLKSLSDKFVGKTLSELSGITDELTDAATLLQDGLKTACSAG